MATQPAPSSFDTSYFQNKLPQIYRSALQTFKKAMLSSTKLHCLFIGFFVLHILLFLGAIGHPTLIICALGGLFTTIFSYIIVLLYYQAKKPEHLIQIQSQFLQSCKEHIQVPPGELQHHLSIAHALTNLAAYLHNFETTSWRLPRFLKPIASLWTRLAPYFYWEDVFKMKKLLLEAAIEEHFAQVEATPTNLEVHASLAGTYTNLAKLYKEALSMKKKKKQILSEGFRRMEKLALEELNILNYYAPNDPWVHEQLAVRYAQLDMPAEEIGELETLFALRPQDTEILYRLGALYFQRNMHAKGLKAYQSMLPLNFMKAKELIALYGHQVLP